MRLGAQRNTNSSGQMDRTLNVKKAIDIFKYLYNSLYMFCTIYIYIHTYLPTYLHTYIHTVCIYIYIHRVCIYIYIYTQTHTHMGVSYLKIIHFNSIFLYKPSILGYPRLWNPSYTLPLDISGQPQSPNQSRLRNADQMNDANDFIGQWPPRVVRKQI